MPVVDKMKEMVGITPTYSCDEREAIRTKARAAASEPWFKTVLDHHAQIEHTFAALRSAGDGEARAALQHRLELILTAHAIAEEAIIYPAMKLIGYTMDAKHAYAEQAVAKMEMVALGAIPDKMCKDYDTKLEAIRRSVIHHMVEEERDFFVELARHADAALSAKMNEIYLDNFTRYLG